MKPMRFAAAPRLNSFQGLIVLTTTSGPFLRARLSASGTKLSSARTDCRFPRKAANFRRPAPPPLWTTRQIAQLGSHRALALRDRAELEMPLRQGAHCPNMGEGVMQRITVVLSRGWTQPYKGLAAPAKRNTRLHG